MEIVERCLHIISCRFIGSAHIWGYRLLWFIVIYCYSVVFALYEERQYARTMNFASEIYLTGSVPAPQVPTYHGGPFLPAKRVQVNPTLPIPDGSSLHV